MAKKFRELCERMPVDAPQRSARKSGGVLAVSELRDLARERRLTQGALAKVSGPQTLVKS